MELNLTSFETAIKSFLDNMAKEDAQFAQTYAKPNKSIEECCKYITQQVEANRKNNEKCVAVSDDEVYGLAIHYYDEDDIKVDDPKSKVEVAAPAQIQDAKAKPKKTRSKKSKATSDSDIPEPLSIPLF